MWWGWNLLCQVHGSVLQNKTGGMLVLTLTSSADGSIEFCLILFDILLLEILCLLSFFYRSFSNGVILSVMVCHLREEHTLDNTLYCWNEIVGYFFSIPHGRFETLPEHIVGKPVEPSSVLKNLTDYPWFCHCKKKCIQKKRVIFWLEVLVFVFILMSVVQLVNRNTNIFVE